MFSGINAIEFAKRFCSNEACIQYLEEQKWKSGYQCKVCGCPTYIKGKTWYHRRCRQCGYGESVTANTLFHDIRMPLQKAFFMAFRITSKKKGMSTVELAAEVGVQQKTAWLFKRKMQLAMKQSLSARLEDNVEVDEFTVGGRQKDHYGRKTGKKKATLIAVEKLGDGKVGNIHIEPIENFKADTLKYAIKRGVADSAKIKADDFQSYKTFSEEMNIERIPSHKGKNFKELHNQIMLFKNWLRGIHHKCSNTLYFAYCDEYTFRFNKRNNRKAIFGQLIKAMLHSNPHPKPILKTLRAYST